MIILPASASIRLERPQATETELVAFARERLAGYKVPQSVRFAEQLPKCAVGKVLRRAARDPLWQGGARGRS